MTELLDASIRGPLVLLYGFHPSILEICSMHTLNLGLAYDLNGAAVHFGCKESCKHARD